ncbi:flagellar export chaperone FliS [Curvibacter sp. APW13]|uniref:flagellar export chaperone FliS n=1 Tax=Curvibacter sp. APW13 TaxID=3077236 RepID=UPI0028DDDB50|nr:flagellar export chaperone FliS [Curvibacter sp. APW13]MDT8992892.1 flagellar export chaperone FliS [Curvibacter sp. APW13]
MFTPVSTRAASVYKRVNVETGIESASPHQLVVMLFDALQQYLLAAQGAMERGDVALKCQKMGAAIRVLDEGLRGALNLEQGGDIARNLDAVYEFCVNRLTVANLKNDPQAITEVMGIMAPIASGWKQMNGQTPANGQSR